EDAMRRGQDMCRKYCAGCSKEIVGGYSIVDSKPLHSGCFVCHTCKHPLTRYFMDGGKFYCPDHIPGKQRMSCHACHQPITGAYVEVNKNPFHPDCLKCTKCRTVLEGSFHLMQDQPYCANCP
ncbi:MAG: LIM domain-containing protein, partial [archaeon]|nr:LIM domain-containing protein [archaeon]